MFFISNVVCADVIFDNGSPDLALPSGISDLNSSIQIAEDFILSAGLNTITGVQWWGGYRLNESMVADDFTIRIFENNSSDLPVLTPLHNLSVGNIGRAYIGVDGASQEIYEYSASIQDITLAPGTQYWFSIVNSSGSGVADDWAWARALNSGFLSTLRPSSSNVWEANNTGEFAFNFTNNTPVPAPSTIMLFGIGLLGLAGVNRRKK